MIPTRFELARVTLEFDSPMLVGTGGGDDLFDAVCVEDANGLPTISATGIIGVLRHAEARRLGKDPHTDQDIIAMFGGETKDQGKSSRVWASWAAIHDSRDRPVSALDAPLDDPVLSFAASGVLRDHVRIGTRGVVDGAGKFDERLVPAGARFTFELGMHGSGGGLAPLVALLHSPQTHLGGRSRRGFGRFKVLRWSARSFDLSRPSDWAAYKKLSVDLRQDSSKVLKAKQVPQPWAGARSIVWTLRLRPEQTVLFGGGAPTNKKGAEHVDMFNVREPRITWTRGRGQVSRARPFVPVSSIKGALRHRAAFHAHVALGRFVDDVRIGESGPIWHEEVQELVDSLFGSVKGRDSGQPGRVFIFEPQELRDSDGVFQHVSLDRFTQGPMDGMLFGEAPLDGFGETWQVQVSLQLGNDTGRMAIQALQGALEDLCQGRLALGGGASRGHGYFRGSMDKKEVSR